MAKAIRIRQRDDETGWPVIYIERLWRAVRTWARKHGYEYASSYGIVGVAPT